MVLLSPEHCLFYHISRDYRIGILKRSAGAPLRSGLYNRVSSYPDFIKLSLLGLKPLLIMCASHPPDQRLSAPGLKSGVSALFDSGSAIRWQSVLETAHCLKPESGSGICQDTFWGQSRDLDPTHRRVHSLSFGIRGKPGISALSDLCAELPPGFSPGWAIML